METAGKPRKESGSKLHPIFPHTARGRNIQIAYTRQHVRVLFAQQATSDLESLALELRNRQIIHDG
jgi:hypothetical protein